MDFDHEIDELLKGHTLRTDKGQRRAFLKCMKYADKKYGKSTRHNPFMAAAAKRCMQAPVFKGIDRLVDETGSEKLHLAYSKDTGPVLTGNRDGLAYLSELLKMLSRAELKGEHVHFYYGEPPLQGESFPLVIYYEPDEWFDEHAAGPAKDATETADEPVVPSLDIESVIAFSIAEETPPPLMMRKCKLYKIISVHKYEDTDKQSKSVWCKSVRDPTDTTYVFEFVGEDGTKRKIGLDIADRSVSFYSAADLEQVV